MCQGNGDLAHRGAFFLLGKAHEVGGALWVDALG